MDDRADGGESVNSFSANAPLLGGHRVADDVPKIHLNPHDSPVNRRGELLALASKQQQTKRLVPQ